MELNYIHDLVNKMANEMANYKEKRIKEVLDKFFDIDLDIKNAKEIMDFIRTKRHQGYEILIDDGFNYNRDAYIEIRHNKDVLHRELLMSIEYKFTTKGE